MECYYRISNCMPRPWRGSVGGLQHILISAVALRGVSEKGAKMSHSVRRLLILEHGHILRRWTSPHHFCTLVLRCSKWLFPTSLLPCRHISRIDKVDWVGVTKHLFDGDGLDAVVETAHLRDSLGVGSNNWRPISEVKRSTNRYGAWDAVSCPRNGLSVSWTWKSSMRKHRLARLTYPYNSEMLCKRTPYPVPAMVGWECGLFSCILVLYKFISSQISAARSSAMRFAEGWLVFLPSPSKPFALMLSSK